MKQIIIYLLLSLPLLADTLVWSPPDATPAGNAPPISGYEVWEKVNGVWELDQTLGLVTTAEVTPEVGNPTGKFAVRALWSGGRSGLSDPVETNGWKVNLPAPDGSNTVNPAMSQAAIQAVLDAASPGDVIYFDGGTYQHNPTSTYLYLGGAAGTVNGTAGNYITIMPVPGETATIRGVSTAGNGQMGLSLSGDYWRVYGMDITEFGEFGVTGRAENCIVEECRVYNNYNSNINIGNTPSPYSRPETLASAGGVVRYCDLSFSSVGSGAGYGGNDYRFVRNVVRYNGFDEPIGAAPPRMNVYGGGNSDAYAGGRTSRNYAVLGDDDFPEGTAAWTAPTGSLNERNHFLQNLSYGNADDAMDIMPGHGSRVVGNFSWRNNPGGGMAVKSVTDRFGSIYLLGNVSYAQTSYPEPTDTLYLRAVAVGAIEVGDVLTGGSSGATGTVTGFVDFDGGNGNAEAVAYLTNVTGSWSNDENILVDSVVVTTATVTYQKGWNLRPDGRTLFFHQGVLAPSNGSTLWVGGATITYGDGVLLRSGSWAGGDAAGWMRFRNEPVGGTITAGSEIRVGDSNGALIGVVYGVNTTEWGALTGYPAGESFSVNNTGFRTSLSDRRDTLGDPYGLTTGNLMIGSATNFFNVNTNVTFNNLVQQPSAQIENTTYDPPHPVLSGSTIEEKWRNVYREHAEQIMPTAGSNLLDDVPVVAGIHHSTAADDLTAPSDPEDLEKLHWYGAAPDMGAGQFTEYWPPVLVLAEDLVINATTTTVGTLNVTP